MREIARKNMILNILIILVPLLIAIRNSYVVPANELNHENYDAVLRRMNASSLTKIICGILSILIAVVPIVDFFLEPTDNDFSPFFLMDHQEHLPYVVAAGVIAILWLIYIARHLDYKNKNKENLTITLNTEEKKRASVAAELAEKQHENDSALSRLTSKYGKSERIISLRSSDINDAFIVFPQTQHLFIEGQIIPFSQVVGCEIKDDTFTTIEGKKEEITKSDTGNTIGRAIVGGLVAGPAGAIIGGATSKKTTEVIDNTKEITHHHYYAVISLANASNPLVKIDCGEISPNKAEEIHAIISGIVFKQPKTITDEDNELIANELLKLAELKERGILTQQEFDQQKQRLLTRSGAVAESKSISNNLPE